MTLVNHGSDLLLDIIRIHVAHCQGSTTLNSHWHGASGVHSGDPDSDLPGASATVANLTSGRLTEPANFKRLSKLDIDRPPTGKPEVGPCH